MFIWDNNRNTTKNQNSQWRILHVKIYSISDKTKFFCSMISTIDYKGNLTMSGCNWLNYFLKCQESWRTNIFCIYHKLFHNFPLIVIGIKVLNKPIDQDCHFEIYLMGMVAISETPHSCICVYINTIGKFEGWSIIFTLRK